MAWTVSSAKMTINSRSIGAPSVWDASKASFTACASAELRALGRPAFWRHRSLASALAQLQIVFAGGCVLPYRNLTPESPLRVYSCVHSARFSADQAAHGLFLYAALVFPLCVDAWYCCAACRKRCCRSEASTTALGTTKRSMSMWGDKKLVHMFHCWLTGGGGGGALEVAESRYRAV